ncbi:Gfo/Idh/MocA family oxidoreductase [Halomonas sp. EF61]|uniref:Gfo/Idh/MocA family protein n=1 Tax=Halomonas sp. EF61 TaxID=2950869 RepID=UPI0032DE749F
MTQRPMSDVCDTSAQSSLPMTGQASPQASCEAEAARPLRLAMIGGGVASFIGQVHRAAAQMDGRYQLVAAALSSNADRSLQQARQLGVARGYGDGETLLREEAAREDGAEVVAILTPNDSHFALARLALELGFHVVCEKPLTNSLAQARALEALAKRGERCFCVAYGYTGYPMVRQARAMIEAGELGEIRQLQCDYVQGHLARMSDAEVAGEDWHMQAAVAGESLILGDIATHAFHMLEYVSGLSTREVSADVVAVVPERTAHDNANLMLRYTNGARGMMWITQAAAGAEHGLCFRIFGSKGGLEWHQENPDKLLFRRLDDAPQWLSKGAPGLHPASRRVSSVAFGHPEGYREAFASLYSDLFEVIDAARHGTRADPLAYWYPDLRAGVRGVEFVATALASSNANGEWVAMPATSP